VEELSLLGHNKIQIFYVYRINTKVFPRSHHETREILLYFNHAHDETWEILLYVLKPKKYSS
jgi:hypothetical protein